MCKYCERVSNSIYCPSIIYTDNCDIGISYDKDNNVFIRLYDENAVEDHTDSLPIKYCPFCGRDLTPSADDNISNVGEHIKRLAVLEKLNYQYVSYRHGYKYATLDNMFKSDSLEVRVRLTNNIILAICIFLDEPLNSPVLFSVYHDDELVMSDNMELDKLVEEVLNVLKRINNTESITKGE